MTRPHVRHWLRISSVLVLPLLLCACGSEFSATRMDLDRHARDFRDHLGADLVATATEDNRKIEAIAAELGLAMGKRVEHTPLPDYDQNRDLYVTATRIAAENWLALARHYAARGRPSEARATYRMILDGYTSPRHRSIRDQATEGLRELHALERRPPSDQTTDNVPPH